MKDDMKYWVWLTSVMGLGARKKQELIEILGGPQNIWEADKLTLAKAGILTGEHITAILDPEVRNHAEWYMERLEKFKIDVISLDDKRYPESLKQIYDPPIALYVRGNIYNREKMIAMVGSRKASTYGLEMSKKLSFDLGSQDITVVSGMARGIDTAAHLGALDAGARTIAVFGCGPDIVYPPENTRLMEAIIEKGAVVTEFPPGVQPLPVNFPIRNRIISGMSLGVVVIEARQRSGSLITARMALEQGRDVFALPGNISHCNSMGTNQLIKDGAKLVTDVKDIMEELYWHENFSIKKISVNKNFTDELSECSNEEQLIMDMLRIEELHIDILLQKTGLEWGILHSALLALELKGYITQKSGGYYRISIN